MINNDDDNIYEGDIINNGTESRKSRFLQSFFFYLILSF